jgi:hypothetical protein
MYLVQKWTKSQKAIDRKGIIMGVLQVQPSGNFMVWFKFHFIVKNRDMYTWAAGSPENTYTGTSNFSAYSERSVKTIIRD